MGFVFQLCSYLPAIGLVTWLLPNLEGVARTRSAGSVPAPVKA